MAMIGVQGATTRGGGKLRRHAGLWLGLVAVVGLALPSVAGAAAPRSRIAVMVSPLASTQRTLLMVDPDGGAPVGPFDLARFTILGLTAEAGGSKVAYLGMDGAPGSQYSINLQDTAGGAPQPSTEYCDSLAFAPTGTALACLARTGPQPSDPYQLWVYDDDSLTSSLGFAARLPRSTGGLSWSPDGKRIAFADGAKVQVQDVKTPASSPTDLVAAVPGTSVYAASFSPDGKELAYVRFSTPPGSSYLRTTLVVRTLASGAERVIVDESQPRHISLIGTPPQWSADGSQIAFTEASSFDGIQDSQRLNYVTLVSSRDGSGRRVLLQTLDGLQSIAWAKATVSNFYIRHLEIAQAIATTIAPPIADPASLTPLHVGWTPQSVTTSSPAATYSLPLVAGRSTLLRIYVGDANAPTGGSTTKAVSYRVTVNGAGPVAPITGGQSVSITPDGVPIVPDQEYADRALNVWLPPSVAVAHTTIDFDVEVNPNQTEPECAGCYPNGNTGELTGVRFQNGGGVTIRPLPITMITSKGVKLPPVPYAGVWQQLSTIAPLRDGGVTVLSPAAPLQIDLRNVPPIAPGTPGSPCDYAYAILDGAVAASGGPPTSSTGIGTVVGYADFPPEMDCGGISWIMAGSPAILLFEPTVSAFAHELGHAVGLPHSEPIAGGNPASGQIPLGYAGLGGVGYEQSGTGTVVYPELTTGDLMSYSPTTWVSPYSWSEIYKGLLALAPTVVPRPGRAPLRPRTKTVRGQRLVTGLLGPDGGTIVTSALVDATITRPSGPKAGTLIALDKSGRTVGSAVILGTPVSETPGDTGPGVVPFVVTVPGSTAITQLALRDTTGKTVTTLKATRYAPTARFTRLPRSVRAGKPATFRFITADRDSPALNVLVYAKRGTGKWRLIKVTAEGAGAATVTPSTLGKRGKLRLRIVASDGLRGKTLTSRAITVRRR